MGFFSSIGNFFSDIERAGTALGTFGGSEVARAVGGDVGKIAGAATNPAAAAGFATGAVRTPGPGTSPTPVPKGPAPDLTNFADYLNASPAQKPGGVNFGAGLSSEQQRAGIATGATNAGIYNTPEIARYYKDLAIRSLTDEQGQAVGRVLPIERQFLEQVFGIRPRNESTASFLSALLRTDGGYQRPNSLIG